MVLTTLLFEFVIHQIVHVNRYGEELVVDQSHTERALHRAEELLIIPMTRGFERHHYTLLALSSKMEMASLATLARALIDDFTEYLSDYERMAFPEAVIMRDPIGGFLPGFDAPKLVAPVVFHNPSMEILAHPQLKAILSKLQRVSRLHSAPDLFFSPSGSDVYTIAYSLLDGLRGVGYWRGRSIAEAAAGRGDFAAAALRLGIRGRHFSRRDTFTSVGHHARVELQADYDLETVSSCPTLVSALQNLPYDSEEDLTTRSMIETAKDKRACSESVTYCSTDSARELVELITTENPTLPTLASDLGATRFPPSVTRISQNQPESRPRLPTSTKIKELEQNVGDSMPWLLLGASKLYRFT